MGDTTGVRSSRLRLRRAGLAIALAWTLSSCYMPTPAAHSVLHVSPAGAYTLDGKAGDAAELAAAIGARHASTPDLVVEIHASPAASSAAVNAAVQAIRLAHARVAFARDEGPR